jgi:hypothetical protein
MLPLRRGTRVSLLVLLLSLCSVVPAFATEFAVLRQRNSVECPVPNGGTGADLRPSSMLITIPDSALDTPKVLTIDFNPVLPPTVVPPSAGTYVFDIKLTDPSTNEVITLFADPVTIGFEERPLPDGLTKDKLCLGYLDESSNEWKCEDNALKTETAGSGTSMLCGKTTHFTLFALAPTAAVPEPSGAMALLTVGGAAGMLRRIRRR